MDQAEAAHQLSGEVSFFAAEGGASGEGNPLRAVDGVPRRVLGDEGGVSGCFDALSQLVEHVVPTDLLPAVRTRRSVQRAFDPAGAGGELHRGGALWTEPALVDRAVGVALDLEQLDGSVGLLLRIGDQGAPNRAIGADRMSFAGAGDPERLPNLGGVRHVESQDRKSRRPRPRGAQLEEVATSDLWHPIPPGSGTADGFSSLPISL